MSDPQSLKSMGLKATFPRLKILELFEKSKMRHMTAEDVYRLLLADNIWPVVFARRRATVATGSRS